jgi:hypothetical protein
MPEPAPAGTGEKGRGNYFPSPSPGKKIFPGREPLRRKGKARDFVIGGQAFNHGWGDESCCGLGVRTGREGSIRRDGLRVAPKA